MRGLRQGDPLSPYLFILCQDVLSRMLEAEFSVGRLSGVKASFNGPALTYVMYADNLVLFSKANSREARVIDKCLDRYCSWSGQKINYNKSGLAFSKATHKPVMRSIKQLLQMKRLQKDTMYHGAPMVLSRSPTKSITQTIPVYTMSYFEIPSTICDNLDATTRRFSWKPKSSNGTFLALKSWSSLCQSKREWGSGF